jgi:hypothetical protein
MPLGLRQIRLHEVDRKNPCLRESWHPVRRPGADRVQPVGKGPVGLNRVGAPLDLFHEMEFQPVSWFIVRAYNCGLGDELFDLVGWADYVQAVEAEVGHDTGSFLVSELGNGAPCAVPWAIWKRGSGSADFFAG